MKIICWLKTIWYTLKHGVGFSGHSYLLMYENKDVQILQCEKCGNISFAWLNHELCEEYNKFLESENKK
jgi:hypothetical protein